MPELEIMNSEQQGKEKMLQLDLVTNFHDKKNREREEIKKRI